MLKPTIGAVVALCLMPAVCAAAEAPPFESMNCQQMTAELVAAGQKMASQLDPEFAQEAQAMAAEASGANASGAAAGAMGMTAVCSIPGLGMLCMVGQQAQMAGAGEQTEANIARMQAQAERLEKAMEGLDQERLMALSQRFEEMKCEVPQ